MNTPRLALVATTLCLLALQSITLNAAEVVGWIEPVTLPDYELRFRAKLDTGAGHSSLNTRNHQLITKEGKPYIRFSLIGGTGKKRSLELPLLRQANIRRHFGNSQERPVVLLSICLGNVEKRVEVNLVDRSGFDYQLLLGRSFLKGDFYVDSSQQMTTQPGCQLDSLDR